MTASAAMDARPGESDDDNGGGGGGGGRVGGGSAASGRSTRKRRREKWTYIKQQAVFPFRRYCAGDAKRHEAAD